MTQHGLLHSGVTTATQPHAQHPENSELHAKAQQFSPLEHSLRCERSSSPVSSHGATHDHAEASDLEVTPPTSSSGLSSQEIANFHGRDCSVFASEGAIADTLPTVLSKSPAPSANANSAGRIFESIIAPKRTSSGQIKISNTPGGDGEVNNHGSRSRHSRNPSLPSNGSSVTEVGCPGRLDVPQQLTFLQLSQELRTRLSYAMVKVKNGWEANNLEEIGSLTSQHASPRTPSTQIALGCSAQSVQSPRTAMAPTLRRQGSSGVSSDSSAAAGGSSHLDNGVQGATIQRRRVEARPQKRGLAPPADIVPGAQRRPHHASQPPNGYRSVRTLKATGTKQRTASQNAAMEADAVETLLFMASPGNTSHHPSTSLGNTSAARPSAATSSPTSPLGSEFPSQEPLASPQRHVAFTEPTRRALGTVDALSRSDEIDRMIDETDDVISDDGGLEYLSNPTYSISARR